MRFWGVSLIGTSLPSPGGTSSGGGLNGLLLQPAISATRRRAYSDGCRRPERRMSIGPRKRRGTGRTVRGRGTAGNDVFKNTDPSAGLSIAAAEPGGTG